MQALRTNARRSDQIGHRFGERIPLEVPVRLNVEGRTLGRGLIRNASISGAFIETALDLPAHTNLVVTLTRPRESAPDICEFDACVVRVIPSGFAVEWRDMACPNILALLERAAGRGAGSLCADRAME